MLAWTGKTAGEYTFVYTIKFTNSSEKELIMFLNDVSSTQHERD
jgi:hypothetical protein